MHSALETSPFTFLNTLDYSANLYFMGLLRETQTGEKVEGGDTFKIHKKSAGRNIIVLIPAI